MAKGANFVKKTQLRRCAVCQKVGHNKSTCLARNGYAQTSPAGPEAASQINQTQTVRPPLKFFVHHVQYQNHESPHLVNLREEKNRLLEDIQAVAPEENRSEER